MSLGRLTHMLGGHFWKRTLEIHLTEISDVCLCLRIWRGFFEGVCAPCNTTAYFRDPPPTPTHNSRMVSWPAPPQGLPAAVKHEEGPRLLLTPALCYRRVVT